MHTNNVEPRHSWTRQSPRRWSADIDAELELCLSCGSPSGNQVFCKDCRRRSRQGELTSWDDLGVGD